MPIDLVLTSPSSVHCSPNSPPTSPAQAYMPAVGARARGATAAAVQAAAPASAHAFANMMIAASDVPSTCAAPVNPAVRQPTAHLLLSPLVELRPTAVRIAERTLLPTNGQPMVKFSNIIAQGSFAEIRYGVDASGRSSAWRIVNVSPCIYMHSDETPWNATSFAMLRRELSALEAARSPLLPVRAYLDEKCLFYMSIPAYPADGLELTCGLMPLTDTWTLQRGAALRRLGQAAMLVGLAIARPLARLHQAGWVHGDVKLENLLYEKVTGLELGDFGLADRGPFVYDSAGTPSYAAPEMLGYPNGSCYSTYESDMFALGVTLSHFMTGGRYHRADLFCGDAAKKVQALIDLRFAWRQRRWQQPRSMGDTLTIDTFLADLMQTDAWLGYVIVQKLLCTSPISRWSSALFVQRAELHQRVDSNFLAPGVGHGVLRQSYRTVRASGIIREAPPIYEQLWADHSRAPEEAKAA